MLDDVREKMDLLQMLANGDDAYYGMLLRLRKLEKEFDTVVGNCRRRSRMRYGNMFPCARA